MNKKTLVILAVAIFALLAFAGCGSNGDSPVYIPDATAKPTEVSTPYGALLYPSDWADNVKIETTESDSMYSINFMCKIGEKTFDLFSVVFSQDVQGNELVGYVEKDGTKTPVYLNHSEFVSDGTLTSEEEDIVYGMLEGVNDVRYYIQQLDGFSSK